VSIILPVHNQESTVEVCLRTLIHQSYPKKEIIVVDDGSTDRTVAILSRLAGGYPSLIRLVPIPHSGAARARNIGLQHSKGEVILFAEGDAIYSSEYLTRAVNCLMANPRLGGVCMTGATWITKPTFITECIEVESRIRRKMLEDGRLKPFYAWVFRREALIEVNGFDERLFQAEDKDLLLRVRAAGYEIGVVGGINWRHRRGQGVKAFLKRCYLGGKTRILFVAKHRRVWDFVRSTYLLWAPLGLFPILPLLPWMTLTALLYAGSALYKSILIWRSGWNLAPNKKYLLLFPLFFLARYLANALGYVHGLIIFAVRRAAGKDVDWSSLLKR